MEATEELRTLEIIYKVLTNQPLVLKLQSSFDINHAKELLAKLDAVVTTLTGSSTGLPIDVPEVPIEEQLEETSSETQV